MKILVTVALLVCFQLPAAADEPSLLVFDDFSKLDPGWGGVDAVQTVVDGKLQLAPKPNSIYASFREGNVYRDADIRVKVSLAAGGPEQAAGIIFWGVDYSNYYFAQLFIDGTVGVARRTRGQVIQPVPQVTYGYVKKGTGAVNEIRVVTRGNRGEMYVNDQLVAEFRGFPPEEGGKVGLRGASGADPYKWRFSDFSIRRPPSAASQPSPPSGDIVLEEDFSRLDPAWGFADDVQSVSGNELRIRPQSETDYEMLYNGELFGDIDMRADVTLIQGGQEEPAGIVFWAADFGNCYSVILYSDGTLGVARRQGRKSVYPVQGDVRAAVKKGLGQTNELRVVTAGSYATVYVNGSEITTLRGFPPAGGSKIGFRAGSEKDRYTWAFSNLTVRKVAGSSTPRIAPSAGDANVLFADDFATLDPAWGQADDVCRVADNRLLLRPGAKKSSTILYDGGLFGDCDIRAKIALAEGGADSPAGIVFWAADYDHYYVARLYTDGVVGIARMSEGKWTYPAGRKIYGAVREGEGATNEIRIVTRGDVATMYVNDKQIATVKGAPPAGGSRIGVKASSGDQPYRWSFSDLIVRKTPAAAEGTAESVAFQPLPKETVDAWTAAGAKPGVMRIGEFGTPLFTLATVSETNAPAPDLPAFQITPTADAEELAKLPAIPTGFGIMMLNPDQSAAILARQENLQALLLLCPTGDAGVAGVGRLKGLRTLQLNGPRISDAALLEVAQLENLKALTLGSPLFTDAGMAKLAGLAKLEILNSSGNQVTDFGLETIAALPALRMLNLSGTGVTDRGLEYLARAKNLQTLNLIKTKVTATGLERLQAALPDCRIIIP